jgi:hypothetical protein
MRAPAAGVQEEHMPATFTRPMVTVSVKLSHEAIDKLDALGRHTERTRAQVLRWLVASAALTGDRDIIVEESSPEEDHGA